MIFKFAHILLHTAQHASAFPRQKMQYFQYSTQRLLSAPENMTALLQPFKPFLAQPISANSWIKQFLDQTITCPRAATSACCQAANSKTWHRQYMKE